MNTEVTDDDLNLESLVRKRLMEMEYSSAREDTEASLPVYVDADELPGAIKPSGTYKVTGNKVEVKLVIRRDGKEPAKVEVIGSEGDVAGLAQKIVVSIEDALSKMNMK